MPSLFRSVVSKMFGPNTNVVKKHNASFIAPAIGIIDFFHHTSGKLNVRLGDTLQNKPIVHIESDHSGSCMKMEFDYSLPNEEGSEESEDKVTLAKNLKINIDINNNHAARLSFQCHLTNVDSDHHGQNTKLQNWLKEPKLLFKHNHEAVQILSEIEKPLFLGYPTLSPIKSNTETKFVPSVIRQAPVRSGFQTLEKNIFNYTVHFSDFLISINLDNSSSPDVKNESQSVNAQQVPKLNIVLTRGNIELPSSIFPLRLNPKVVYDKTAPKLNFQFDLKELKYNKDGKDITVQDWLREVKIEHLSIENWLKKKSGMWDKDEFLSALEEILSDKISQKQDDINGSSDNSNSKLSGQGDSSNFVDSPEVEGVGKTLEK